MRIMPVLLLLLSLGEYLDKSVHAQIKNEVSVVHIVNIPGHQPLNDSIIVVPEDSNTTKTVAGKISIDSEASIVSVTARDVKGNKVPTAKVTSTNPTLPPTFIIASSGRVLVDVTCVDFDKRIFEQDSYTLNITPVVPDPIDPDNPNPDNPDNPDPLPVPDDRFDNLGKKVRIQAVDLPKRLEVAALYVEAAETLRTNLDADISNVGATITTKRHALLGTETEKWMPLLQFLQTELNNRWPAHSDPATEWLADFYIAIANGLKW